MNQTEITKDDDQTLAPEMLIDKALYLMLQLTEEELDGFVAWLKCLKGGHHASDKTVT